MKKPEVDQVRTMMKKIWFHDLEVLEKIQQMSR